MQVPDHLCDLLTTELLFLVTCFILLCGDFIKLYHYQPDYIDQLDTFESLTESLIDCNLPKAPSDKISSRKNGARWQEPKCPIDLDRLKYIDEMELDTWLNYRHIKHGGHFEPLGCEPRQTVAIIVPYRDHHLHHLEKFLLYVHQFLPDQLIRYAVFVVEQMDAKPFDPAKLFHIGANYVQRTHANFCCFIFHELDLMPLDQRNLYMCSRMPRQLSVATSDLRYQLKSEPTSEGVIAMTSEHYRIIQVLSGQEGEEEDMFKQAPTSGLRVERTPLDFGTYIRLYDVVGNTTNLSAAGGTRGIESDIRSVTKAGHDEVLSVEMRQLCTVIKCKT